MSGPKKPLLYPEDPALSRAVLRLLPPPEGGRSLVALAACREVHKGLRDVVIWLARTQQQRKIRESAARMSTAVVSLRDRMAQWNEANEKARADERRTCPRSGKVRHLTRAGALDHADGLLKSGRGQGDVSAYWCHDCRSWHVGRERSRRTGPMRIVDGDQ